MISPQLNINTINIVSINVQLINKIDIKIIK